MEYFVDFISAIFDMWETDTVFTLTLLASIGPVTFDQIWSFGRDFGLIGGVFIAITNFDYNWTVGQGVRRIAYRPIWLITGALLLLSMLFHPLPVGLVLAPVAIWGMYVLISTVTAFFVGIFFINLPRIVKRFA